MGERSLGVSFSYSPCILFILVITAFTFHTSTLF